MQYARADLDRTRSRCHIKAPSLTHRMSLVAVRLVGCSLPAAILDLGLREDV